MTASSDFEIRRFQDFPKYCRAAIYIGGDQQVHIMQPFDDKKQEAGPEPRNIDEWVKLIDKHGQVVVSFEALDDFIEALKKFRAERLMEKVDDVEAINNKLDYITRAMKEERRRRGLPEV